MADDRTYLFESMKIPRAVFTLAVPTIISSLVMVLYSMADTYFVGALNDPVQNAAVTLASPVLLAFNAVTNLFGVGSSSMMSRALGRKDYDTFEKTSAFGFYCALASAALFSFCFTVFRDPLLILLGATSETANVTGQYLKWTTTCGAVPAILNIVLANLVRSEGASMHAGIGTMSGCLLNIVLDPVFILPWGLGMGAAGAGLATFISNCVACCYFLVLISVKSRKGSTYISLNPGSFGFSRVIVLGVCAVGIPASIQNLLNVTGMTVLNNFTAAYGSDAVAAMGISQKINMIPLYIAMGMGQGIMPLISYNYASGDIRRMKDTVCFAMGVALAFLTALTVIFYTGSGFFISLFMEAETVVAYGTRFLKGMCLALPFLCVDFLAVGVYQSCGMGGKALIFAIMRKIVLEVPALFILNRIFPLYGLAYAQFTAELILSVAAAIVLARIFKDLEKKYGCSR